MSALLESILVLAAVGAAVGFLVSRFFRSRKTSCKCGGCPVRPTKDGGGFPPADIRPRPTKD